METCDVCDLTKDSVDFLWVFNILQYVFVVRAWRLRDLYRSSLVVKDSGKERTYDLLWVWFLVCFDLYLHIKAAVASIWMRRNIFTNRGVNESKVRATDIQRGS